MFSEANLAPSTSTWNWWDFFNRLLANQPEKWIMLPSHFCRKPRWAWSTLAPQLHRRCARVLTGRRPCSRLSLPWEYPPVLAAITLSCLVSCEASSYSTKVVEVRRIYESNLDSSPVCLISDGPGNGILLLESNPPTAEDRPLGCRLSTLNPEGVRKARMYFNLPDDPIAMDYDPWLRGVWVSSRRGDLHFGKLRTGRMNLAFLTPDAANILFVASIGPGRAIIRDAMDRYWIISALSEPAKQLNLPALGMRYPQWSAPNKTLACPAVTLLNGPEPVLCSNLDGVPRIRKLPLIENGHELYGALTDNGKYFCEGRADTGIIVHDLDANEAKVIECNQVGGLIAAGGARVIVQNAPWFECYDVEQDLLVYRKRCLGPGESVNDAWGTEKYLVYKDGVGCFVADGCGVTLIADG